MPSVYVKPRAGGRVRMPERNYRPMAPEGSWVERIDYYERLIISGDLATCEPPQDPPAAQPSEPKPAEPPKGGSFV